MDANNRLLPVLAMGLVTLACGCGGASEPDSDVSGHQAGTTSGLAVDDATAQRLALERLVAQRREQFAAPAAQVSTGAAPAANGQR